MVPSVLVLACAGEPLGVGTDAGRVRDAGRRRDASADAGSSEDAGPTGDAGSLEDAGVDAGRPRLGPPYPVVLAHGFFGFEDFAGAGFVDYYWHVRAELAARGETLVFTPAVDPFADSETRGAQLLAHVEAILAETGHAKVNLIGHSQGGLDARVVANLRPDLVASVTSVATPHEGTRVADVVLRIVADERLRDLLDALVRVIAAPLYDAAGAETSVFAALRLFSSEGIAAFNAAHPDEPSVPYFSIAGRSDNTLALSLCRVDGRPDFLRRYDDVLDPVDSLLSLSESILDGDLFDPHPNDGLVTVESARHGTFLGCVPADHLDEVGHLFGDRAGLFNGFDHVDLYADLVAYLRARGY
jgi:triacylglycerol lipase